MVKVDLPPPETPVMQVNRPAGISPVTSFRLLPRAPITRMTFFLSGFLRRLRDLDLARAGQVLAGQALGLGHDVGGLALGDDVAPVDAGGGAHVDDVVGGQDRLLVMLHHQHRIAQIAQLLQAGQQPGVVALVQADRRLVQHVQHPRQPRADL